MSKNSEVSPSCSDIWIEQTVQQKLDEIFGFGLGARFNGLDKTIEITPPRGDVLLKIEADTDFALHSDRLKKTVQEQLRVALRNKKAPIQDPVILCEALRVILQTSHLKFTFARTQAGFILINLVVPPLSRQQILAAKLYGVELRNSGRKTKKILLFFPKGPKPHPEDLAFAKIVPASCSQDSLQRLLAEAIELAQKRGT